MNQKYNLTRLIETVFGISYFDAMYGRCECGKPMTKYENKYICMCEKCHEKLH